jgi:hypothetical protein
MNRTSVPHQAPRPTGAAPRRRAVTARDAGFGLIRRINRWLIAGAVATAGLFSLLAAHAFHGHAVATGGAPSNSSAVSQSGSSSGVPQSSSGDNGSSLQAPAQAPATSAAGPAPVVSGGS